MARIDVDLADLRMKQKRWAEAEVLSLGSLEVFEETVGLDDSRTKWAAAKLVRIYEELGRPEEAEKYRAYAEK